MPSFSKCLLPSSTEWGIPESQLKKQNHAFLWAKTDHNCYKSPGKVSNYVHSLKIGQYLQFKHTAICQGKISFPFQKDITAITMIAVGAGVAPMVRILKAILDKKEQCKHVQTIRLLYGARTVADILQRKQLDQWHEQHNDRFKVCYCIGSRWNNVHFAAKTDHKEGPPLPKDWETIPSDRKELGWADGDKVVKRGASNAQDESHRVFVCGLPGVYLSLVGSRFDPKVEEGTQLHRLGYRDHQVVKF